jgi:hypothetical protein
VLRKIFGLKRDEVTREWSKVQNKELSDMCSSPNFFRMVTSRRMRWAEHVAYMGERRGTDRVLVGKSEGTRPHGKTRLSGKIILRWIFWMWNWGVGGGIGWIGLAQDRNRWWALVNALMNPWVPYNAGKFLTSCRPVSFSRRTLLHGVS